MVPTTVTREDPATPVCSEMRIDQHARLLSSSPSSWNHFSPLGRRRYVPAIDNVPEEMRYGLDFMPKERLRFYRENQDELARDYTCVT
ncbi:hypothetical protein AAC387_Pa02g2399 [Persea americana]